ncbi:MAG: T9SS type A sorting domain-containing protein [Ignavibacteriaceae bacterium]|nr:T9SS type A sorting domain-containing protein [Ignavibacteriaceae bacterium]
MKNRSITILFLAFLLSSIQISMPQNWLKVDSVFNPSGVYALSFSCPAFADMDGDGKTDLFVGNSTRAQYFKNISDSGITSFSYDEAMLASIYTTSIGVNNYYPLTADLDNDGDNDLIIGGYNGFIYYRNDGNPASAVWTKIDTFFQAVNPLIGTDARPVLVDIDNDGDLDLFAGIGESLFGGPTAGITIGFRNTGNNTSAVFTQDNTLTTGLPDAGLNSFPAFADVDADGDYDLLIGRDIASFLFYRNTGSAASPVWTRDFNMFNTMETTTYWKVPVLFDYDNDGDYDLIYGSDNGRLTVYQNTGTPSAPVYTRNNDLFRVIKSQGSGATAALGDFDNDGDYDLISGDWSGKFQYFRNSGGQVFPSFASVSSPLTVLDPGSYSSPTVVDLDGDGDLDVVAGELNGKLYGYINNGGSFASNNAPFSAINVTGFSHPAFADLDADGDPDLILGAETSSNWRAYRNQGSMTFVEDNTLLTGVTTYSRGKPALADIDLDGDYDLVIGRSFGEVALFENKGTAQAPTWVLNDTLFAGIKVKQSASPAFGDMDGDGKPDMILAEYDGNFTWFKNLMNITVGTGEDAAVLPFGFSLEQNYPNPFNPSTRINFTLPREMKIRLEVYSAEGVLVREVLNGSFASGAHAVQLDFASSGLSSGVYFYSLRGEGLFLSRKMILLK